MGDQLDRDPSMKGGNNSWKDHFGEDSRSLMFRHERGII